MRTMLTWKLPKWRESSVMPLSKAKPRMSSQSPSRRSRQALIASPTACLLTVPNFGPM